MRDSAVHKMRLYIFDMSNFQLSYTLYSFICFVWFGWCVNYTLIIKFAWVRLGGNMLVQTFNVVRQGANLLIVKFVWAGTELIRRDW